MARADVNGIAEAASNNPAVTGELLSKLIGGNQLTSEDAATRNLVVAARDRVQATLDDAHGIINGYIHHRRRVDA